MKVSFAIDSRHLLFFQYLLVKFEWIKLQELLSFWSEVSTRDFYQKIHGLFTSGCLLLAIFLRAVPKKVIFFLIGRFVLGYPVCQIRVDAFSWPVCKFAPDWPCIKTCCIPSAPHSLLPSRPLISFSTQYTFALSGNIVFTVNYFL